jgi:hypothetical protein
MAQKGLFCQWYWVVVVATTMTAATAMTTRIMMMLKCKSHKFSEILVVGHIFLLPERDALLWLFASAW